MAELTDLWQQRIDVFTHTQSFLTDNSKKQVSCLSHVGLPAYDAVRNPGQACCSCSKHTQGQTAIAMATTLDAAETALGGRESPWHEE